LLRGFVNCGCSRANWPIKWFSRRWTFGTIIWLGKLLFYCHLSVLQIISLRTRNDLSLGCDDMLSLHVFISFLIFL